MIRQGTHIIAGTPTPNTSELKAIELTKSAYQQLVDNGLVEEDQNYILIDDESPNIIDDTISSYSNTYSAAHILGLVNTLKEAVYTKAETEASINRKLISAIKYKGKVAETENLPSLAENGDAYYVTGESLLYIYNEDLANYEALGDIADLSAYLTEEEILELLKEKNIKFQYAVMPEASSEFDYPIQYIGATNENYKLGNWYRSVFNSGSYAWEELLIEGKNKDPFETDTIPETAENGTTHLYIGADNANYKKGHVYQYNDSSWNDITAGTIQLKTLPTANENELNKIYQYIGVSNGNYTNGYFYECVESNGSYTWVEKEVQKNNDVPHWTGTHAEYEAQKDTIPDYSILHFTDDYDDNLGVPRKNVSSAAGAGKTNLRLFVAAMLNDIAMQNWENGTYAGEFNSTASGSGDLGSWTGTYQCSRRASGNYTTVVKGTANNKSFSAIYVSTGWVVNMQGWRIGAVTFGTGFTGAITWAQRDHTVIVNIENLQYSGSTPPASQSVIATGLPPASLQIIKYLSGASPNADGAYINITGDGKMVTNNWSTWPAPGALFDSFTYLTDE